LGDPFSVLRGLVDPLEDMVKTVEIKSVRL
jgi:hypothetical protein